MTAAALVVGRWYKERHTGAIVMYVGWSRTSDGRDLYWFRARGDSETRVIDPASVDAIE